MVQHLSAKIPKAPGSIPSLGRKKVRLLKKKLLFLFVLGIILYWGVSVKSLLWNMYAFF